MEASYSAGRIFSCGRKLRCLTNAEEAPGRFTVLSYNILGAYGGLPKWYPHCPPEYLEWKVRFKGILKEITEFNPDIVCLQELDHFRDVVDPDLSKKGYDNVYKQRTGGKEDGCGIFWKRDRFYLRSKLDIEYNSLASKASQSAKQRFITNSVAVIAILDTYDGSPPILVANTHIYWDTKQKEVQEAQARLLVESIESVREPGMALVICGDFNSVPGSDVYNYLLCHHVRVNGELNVQHNLSLLSAYNFYNGKLDVNSDAPFTTYRPTGGLCIDYIFFDPNHLRVTALLELPREEQLKTFNGCPNKKFPSDHISILAEFDRVATATDHQ